jgi:predicted PurR-regulated permease PerM
MLRLRSITPAGLARFVLATGAILVVGQILLSAWVALLPLMVGLTVAYLALPVVDALDHVLPRWLAALLVTLGEIVAVLVVIGLLVPPLKRRSSWGRYPVGIRCGP